MNERKCETTQNIQSILHIHEALACTSDPKAQQKRCNPITDKVSMHPYNRSPQKPSSTGTRLCLKVCRDYLAIDNQKVLIYPCLKHMNINICRKTKNLIFLNKIMYKMLYMWKVIYISDKLVTTMHVSIAEMVVQETQANNSTFISLASANIMELIATHSRWIHSQSSSLRILFILQDGEGKLELRTLLRLPPHVASTSLKAQRT